MSSRSVLLCVLGLLCQVGLSATVSFYGESYIHIPLREDVRNTTLEVRFKTNRPYGVIAFQASSDNYFILQLHDGTFQVTVASARQRTETVHNYADHRFDDLNWHTVKVTSETSRGSLSLSVDETTIEVLYSTPGTYKTLDIDPCIYLGGVKHSLNHMFDGRLKNLRGTFSSAALNGKDLVSEAKLLNDPSDIVEVSWDIDTIFSARRDSPISFLSETSFTSFSHIHPSNERTVSLLLKTDEQTQSALLMYSFTHHSSESHFVALELIDGRLKLIVGKEKEVASVSTDEILDSNWHQIDLSVSPTHLELSVDSRRHTRRLTEKLSAIYGGLLFIGGINHKARSLAVNQELESLRGERSLKGGFIGCIKNIIINSRAYNIHDIHSSRLVGAEGCQEEDKDDCRDFGKCSSRSSTLDSPNIPEHTPHSDSNQDETQVLSVKPVSVYEGAGVILSTDFIEIVYDFRQYGIRESRVMFYITKQPKYGDILIDSGQRRNNDIFTYLDILGKKVSYIHDGSDEPFDEITLELEIDTNRNDEDDIPEPILQRHGFVLQVIVHPINDAPNIVLGNKGVIRIIENTKIRVTSDFLTAEDPDSPPEQLTYTVIEPPNQGYFTKLGRNEVPTKSFTQLEINQREIWFLHLGKGDVTVGIEVSDGYLTSSPAFIFVKPVKLQLTVVKNSGLVLPHGSYAIISHDNLTTDSNVPTQELEIRYDILQPPSYGVLEKQQYVNGEWREVGSFAQRHIDNGHVRYRQKDNTDNLVEDQFSFTVKAKSFTTPYFFFRIQFEQIYLEIRANNKLTLLHKRYGVLTDENLKAVTNNLQLDPRKIVFRIERPPSMGNFHKVEPGQRRIDFSQSPLINNTFTQADVDSGRIYYRLKTNSYDLVSDFTDIRVQTAGTSDKILRLWIEFVPLKSDVQFINNGLKNVIEGDQKTIEKNDLFIQTDAFRVFDFTILTKPQHGTLQLVDSRSSAVISNDISEFTSDDIRYLRLVYKNDNSEHKTDSFTFTAVPQVSKTSLTPSNIPEFSGTFEIQMLMRNDNPPERLVNKVFKVVRDGERRITIDDLAFMDPDIDYDVRQLSYTRRAVTNGQIVQTRNKMQQIYEFTQNDIMNGDVLFRHTGEDKGRADIYVTDGQYYSNCNLEILAGDPFLNIVDNTGAVVRSNNKVQITLTNLSIDTNVNVADEQVYFVLSEGPRQGHLEVNGVKVSEFNLKTLKQNKLSYKHEGRSNIEDYFRFSINGGDIVTDGRFSIQILHEASQIPPRVVNNRVLEAFIGKSQNVIKQGHLLITHTDSLADNLEYLVLVLPKQGSLYVHGNRLTADGFVTFTQLDVNNGDVTYALQNTSAAHDHFIFEVSNGYNALRGLEFLIDIVPYSLPFVVGNLTVIEGGKKTLSSRLLRVGEKYSRDHEILFTITAAPNFGRIEHSNNKGVPVSSFTSVDLGNRKVAYIHDNSESKTDWFTIRARLQDEAMASDVQTVYLTIEGINDEPPVVVRNSGLKVWKGSMTQITSDILSTRDPDSPPKELEYRISAPTNGHISILNNTFKDLVTFKQSWIDEGQLVFVHEGVMDGEFSFQVSDGANTSPWSVFTIRAKHLLLTLRRKQLLHAYPNAMQPITTSHLFSSTNDINQSKPIIYTVTSQPEHGSIVSMASGQPVKANSFNQNDINNSLIFYKHSSDLDGWTRNDSFQFTVNTLYAERLVGQILNIYISYGNLNAENKNQLIKTAPIKVDEGAEMIVAKNNLDVSEFIRNLERIGKRASLRFSLRDQPRHGMLVYRRKPLVKNVRFSQRDINSHRLMYEHDDSDTTFDQFNLTLHLRIDDKTGVHGTNDETTFGLVLNITIQPVNDEPFRLLTTNPYLNVIQGSMEVINQSVLNTVDKDTSPAYIVYEINRESSNGYVAFSENPSQKITLFTQQDVNDGHVIFKQDFHGSSSAFNFQVSDGSFSPYHKSFRINVVKLFVDLTQNSTLFMIQSNATASITQEILNVSTNGLREKVIYTLRSQLRYGKIYVSGKAVNRFSQAHIDRKLVTYLQRDMKSGSDFVEVSIKYQHDQRSEISFYNRVPVFIHVKPLVATGPIEAPKGERVAITLLSLDASLLAERTGDDPVYTILHGPYFGSIMKKNSFSKRQIYRADYRGNDGYKTVREFSHEDVVYMKVFYESFIHNAPVDVQDNFTYVLKAYGAQPAEGVFYIGLTPSENSPIVPVTSKPLEGPDSGFPVTQSGGVSPRGAHSPGNETIEPSSLKHDHVIILAISIPVLVVIALTILAICFVWKSRRKRDYAPPSKKSPRLRPHISGPLSIDQPHVHIQPQEQGSPVSDDSKSLVVEYENTQHIPRTSQACSEEADVVMPMIMSLPGHQSPQHSHHHHIPRSPDISRTEVSSTVPSCKVTPLVDNDTESELEGAVGGYSGYSENNRNSLGSMGDMMEWITNDPELMQHCSATNPPVLRKSQYWV